MPPVSLGGTVLDEVDLERIKVGDNRWGIALSSCVEYPNKKYFFRCVALCFSQTECMDMHLMGWNIDDEFTRMMPPIRFAFLSLLLSSSSKNV